MSDHDEVNDLTLRVAQLETLLVKRDNEIAQLRNRLRPYNRTILIKEGLTHSQATVILALHKAFPQKLAVLDLYDALYKDRNKDKLPQLKTIDVMVFTTRKKIARFGVTLHHIRSEGYYFEDHDMQKLSALGLIIPDLK